MVDVQRVLAVYEMLPGMKLDRDGQGVVLKHSRGPFRITKSGFGTAVRSNIEFVGLFISSTEFKSHDASSSRSTQFSEAILQSIYTSLIHALFLREKDADSNFIHKSVSTFPVLEEILGSQTATHQQKGRDTLREILNLSSAAQQRNGHGKAKAELNFDKLSLNDPQTTSSSSPAPQTQTLPTSTSKARTTALFDRIRLKSSLSTTNNAPTPNQILRRRAIGRIAEIVDILRMKQAQKLNSLSYLPSTSSTAEDINTRQKVSFSLNQIVAEVRGSVSVPVAEEEVKMAVKILAEEVCTEETGTGMGIAGAMKWVSVFEVGNVKSITLVGRGWAGIEVRKWLEAREKERERGTMEL